MKRSWIQDPETGKLIPKEEYCRKPAKQVTFVSGDLQPFVSPVDQSAIYSKRQLREHNKRHGVTDTRDYGDTWFERKAKERENVFKTKGDKAQRIDAIQRALYRHGVK